MSLKRNDKWLTTVSKTKYSINASFLNLLNKFNRKVEVIEESLNKLEEALHRNCLI